MEPIITTERMRLLPVQPGDQRFIFEGLSHPQVVPFYGVRYSTFEATREQMDWYAKNRAEQTGEAWKLVEKSSGQPMGVVSYYHFKPEHNRAETGFWLLPAYWNRGYALEALQALVHYCQVEKSLHRLEAFVEKGNTASSRVLERSGFRYEGTMQDCERKDGRYISLAIYAHLPGHDAATRHISP